MRGCLHQGVWSILRRWFWVRVVQRKEVGVATSDLPSWAWRDPMEVAARREGMSCVGCLFRVVVFARIICVKHTGRGGEQMYRCVDFKREDLTGAT